MSYEEVDVIRGLSIEVIDEYKDKREEVEENTMVLGPVVTLEGGIGEHAFKAPSLIDAESVFKFLALDIFLVGILVRSYIFEFMC